MRWVVLKEIFSHSLRLRLLRKCKCYSTCYPQFKAKTILRKKKNNNNKILGKIRCHCDSPVQSAEKFVRGKFRFKCAAKSVCEAVSFCGITFNKVLDNQ